MNADALAIYQHTLDTLADAVLKRNEAIWERHIQVPHFMSTSDGKLVLKTRSDLIDLLHDFADRLETLGITAIKRRCTTARMLKGETIVGFHTTQMLGQDGAIYPAYPVRWVMQLGKTHWQISNSHAALSEAEWSAAPHSKLAQMDKSKASEDLARRVLVQTLLDNIDTIFMAGDFNGWANAVSLPLVFNARNGLTQFDTRQALRDDFDIYQQEFRIHQVTELTRIVKNVDLISEDELECSYRTHVLSGSQYVVQPWVGAMTFKCVEGQWRVTSISRALGHLNWTATSGEPA